ncbi:DNA-binding protein H-NS [Actinobacillus seminis]|uniref:DNA-binding protein H-NS n=1 Tax=Actinobacillus seminis TaxID=722 RepID=A0A380VC95_9PAST|nr:DNA-binding protein H-NS [Actinobacillus seminis]
MTEILKTLNNIRNLRVLSRGLSLSELETILQKVQTVVEEKRVEVQEIERKEQERQARIEKYKELLAQDGITVDELTEILSSKTSNLRKKRDPRPAKYQYVDIDGKTKT